MSRSALYEEFLNYTRRHHLIAPGDAVLVAVSGGADSVVLLELLCRLRHGGSITLAACHLDHCLRGAESTEDARFVEQLCGRLNVPLESARRDVAALARDSGLGIEETARKVRYEFFAEAARRRGSARVATGHTLSDNAETILQRLIEGAGAAGLSGIPPARPLEDGSAVMVVRPLLFATRQKIEQYRDERGLSSRLDRTNLQPLYLRNRIRHELLALLREYNPSIEEALSRTATCIDALRDLVKGDASSLIDTVASRDESGRIVLDVEGLTSAHPAVSGEVVLWALREADVDGRRLAWAHVEAILDLAAGPNPSGELDLPGALIARREYGRIVIGAAGVLGGCADFQAGLGVPGEVVLPGGAGRIQARPVEGLKLSDFVCGKTPEEELIDASALYGDLYVRFAQTGDRFRPLGAPGARKLQDFFVDEKVPRRLRASTPLVLDNEGIIWVASRRIAERVKVTGQTRHLLQLRFEPSGTPAQ